jgi:hypothetical protein
MSNRFKGPLGSEFIYIPVALAPIALSLFVIFNFAPLPKFDEVMGLAVFTIGTCLLIAGSVLRFVALAFVAIFALARIWQRGKK